MTNLEIAQSLHDEGAQQAVNELMFLLELADELAPALVLEIGTGIGATASAFALKGAAVVTVDIRDPRRGPGNAWVWDEERQDCAEQITRVVGNSHDASTIKAVQADYDLVMIDGDHTLWGGKQDWLNYGPMAPAVLLHDIAFYQNCDPHEDWFPRRFWRYDRDPAWETREEVDVPSGGWGAILR